MYACLVLSDQRPVAAAKFKAVQTPKVLVTGSSWGPANAVTTRTERLELSFTPGWVNAHALCFDPHRRDVWHGLVLDNLNTLVTAWHTGLAALCLLIMPSLHVTSGLPIDDAMRPGHPRTEVPDIFMHP